MRCWPERPCLCFRVLSVSSNVLNGCHILLYSALVTSKPLVNVVVVQDVLHSIFEFD